MDKSFIPRSIPSQADELSQRIPSVRSPFEEDEIAIHLLAVGELNEHVSEEQLGQHLFHCIIRGLFLMHSTLTYKPWIFVVREGTDLPFAIH